MLIAAIQKNSGDHMIRHFLRRLRFLKNRAAHDRQLTEELEFHRVMKQRENEAAGLASADARATAQRQMGNLTQAKESSRDTWSFPLLEQLSQDISVALRSLRRDRVFTATAILSLALGIGANTAIFTAFNAVLLHPLPYAQPQLLFAISQPMTHSTQDRTFDPEFEAWRNENKVFDQLTCWAGAEFDFAGRGSPERLMAARVPNNFLTALRVQPILGRNFSNKEDLPKGPHVVILTNGFWHRHFSSNRSILGQTIKLNNAAYTIVGILPLSFDFPGNFAPEFLVPAQLPVKPNWGSPSLAGFNVIGRLHPGITRERAKADLQLITKRQEPSMPAYFRHSRRNLLPLQVIPLQTYLAGDTRWTLRLLFAAVLILLGIACVNVANLQLSRAAARQSELALRAALGAGRGRLLWLLLTESLLVALAGGACGILLAWSLIRRLGTTTLLPFTAASHLHLGGTVLLFTLSVSILVGLICGWLPALFASKPSLYEVVKGGAAHVVGLGARVRGFFVVSEVALTLLLLVGAFLLLRSLQQVLAINPGFQPEHVLSFQTNFPNAGKRKNAEMALTMQLELERIAALPGVRSVGASSSLMLTRYHGSSSIAIEGQPTAPPGQRPTASNMMVSSDYFQTMRIPLIAGRSFSRADSGHSLPVAIVNVSFARRFFGNADPLGKRLQYGMASDPWTTVVGIVSDTHDDGQATAPSPELYLPYTQEANPDFADRQGVTIRTDLPTSAILPAIRQQIAKIDPTQPIFDIATMEQRLSQSTSSRRTQTALISAFALIALCLAAVGVYGVLSYAVTQTTREIGIRMALGAQKATVLRNIIRRGLLLALGGIAIGLAVSFATVRYLASFLFHVKPFDWISFLMAALLLLILAMLSSYLPGRRAANVDPMTALRYE